MTRKKLSEDVYINRLVALRKMGAAPDIKLSKKLTRETKAKISRAFNKYSEIATAPPDVFKKLNIKKLSKQEKRLIKETGYAVAGDTAYIPMHGHNKLEVTRKKVKGATGAMVNQIQLKRSITSGRRFKSEIEYIGERIDKAMWRENMMSDYKAGKFKKDEYVGVKLFNNGSFTRQISTNIDSIFDYLQNEFKPNNGADLNTLRDNLHVVKIKISDLAALDLDRKAPANVGREKYIRKTQKEKTLPSKKK